MAMTIHHYDFKAECNLIGRSNVIDATEHGSNSTLQTNYALFLALNNLTLSKPNWRFKATGYGKFSTGVVATGFQIIEDDEVLGVVSVDYKGRNVKIKVRNGRIDAKRDRGNGYFTDDPAKAELAIRKHFFKLAKDERLGKALEAAEAVLRNENNTKSWEYRSKKDALLDKAREFAMAHLPEYLQANPGYASRHEQLLESKAQFRVVKAIQEALDNKQHTLVVLDGTQYIVKVGDEAKTYTDEELSFDLRRKIGLLKLVQDKQMISEVGCRVDSSTFVLLPEVKEQSNE